MNNELEEFNRRIYHRIRMHPSISFFIFIDTSLSIVAQIAILHVIPSSHHRHRFLPSPAS